MNRQLTIQVRAVFLPLFGFFVMFIHSSVWAKAYSLQEVQGDIIGKPTMVESKAEETLLDIAYHHNFGHADISLANSDVDIWLPGEGEQIILPSQFILPSAPRQGIILNIPEMRLYYYPKDKKEVITHPIGIGREGWSTPYLATRIIEKKKAPNWYPPESIRQEHEEQGDPLPKIVKAGPDNPLGDYAMRLGIPSYLIHGTNRPHGVGMRVSHGCIRLYPKDIEELFKQVPIGTPVNIVNQPYKLGERHGVIYLEVHPFLEEDAEQFADAWSVIYQRLKKMASRRKYELDFEVASREMLQPNGLPRQIGLFLP